MAGLIAPTAVGLAVAAIVLAAVALACGIVGCPGRERDSNDVITVVRRPSHRRSAAPPAPTAVARRTWRPRGR